MKETRAAIYTRVSSEEQLEGYSLEAQEEANRALCAQRGWQVVHLYEERGRSGKTVFRPEFQAMMRDAEAHLFDVVVVHKLDRFSRSLLDMLTYLNRLHGCGGSLVSATESFDFSTPLGKVVLAVLGALAQWYVDNLAAETRKGKKQRAKAGGWNGTLSFGYTTPRRLREALIALGKQFKDGMVIESEYSRQAELMEDTLEKYAGRHDSAAIPDPFDAPGLVLAYTQYSTGLYSDTDVAWMLNGAGYRTNGHWGRNPFRKETVTKLLQNRFYTGQTSYRGKEPGAQREWIKGSHEPLISQELFDRCQEVRKMHAHQRNTSQSRDVAVYPLSGLLVCVECGSRLHGHKACGERRYRDPARDLGKVCRQKPKSTWAATLEAQASALITHLELPPDWRARALELAAQQVEPQRRDEGERQRRVLMARIERAKDLYVMGDITQEEYQTRRDECQAQMPPELPPPTDLPHLEQIAELLGNFELLWTNANDDERQAIFQALFTNLYVGNGTIVAAEPTAVMWHLLNYGTIGSTSDGNSPKSIRSA